MTIDRSYMNRNTWRRGAVRKAVIKRDGGVCRACGDAGTDGRGQGKGLHLAHLIPVGQYGSTDDAGGVVLLCAGCHRKFDQGRKRR